MTFLFPESRRSNSSSGSDSDCRLFQKSFHKSPTSFNRPSSVFRFHRSGEKSFFNSAAVTGVDTGACGVGAHGINGGQRLSAGVLQRVHQYFSTRPLVHHAFERDQPRQFVGGHAPYQLRKASGLLIGILGLQRHENMKARRARGFQEASQPDGLQNRVNSAGNLQNRREGSARRGIEIEKHIVRRALCFRTAGPRIVIDAAEIREVQQRCKMVGHHIKHVAAALFGMHDGAIKPLGNRIRRFLLKKGLFLNSVGIAPQHHWAILQKRKHQMPGAKIIGQQVALPDAAFGKIYLVQMSQPQHPAVNLDV